MTVAILDLDRFHEFNETHGHQAGDDALRDCAAAWRQTLPRGTYLARYGGEEFAVLLPGADPARADEILDVVRRATPAPLTVSVGCAPRPRPAHPRRRRGGGRGPLHREGRGRDVVMSGDVDTPRPATVDLRLGQ